MASACSTHAGSSVWRDQATANAQLQHRVQNASSMVEMADIEAEVVETDDLTPVNRGMEALVVSPDLPGLLVGKPTPHPEKSTSLLEYKCLEDDEIRLIKILPGHWDGPLALELDNHHLTTCPPYLALSYAWGDMTTTDPAFVNGQTHPISQSLFSALRRLRTLASSSPDFASSVGFPLDPVYVWADWLSLNQANEREKEVQIPRMGQIYGKAARVIAWLGENNEDEESGSKLLMELAKVKAPDWQGKVLPWNDERYREALFQVMGHRKTDFVNILHSLLIRPFFLRLWIIQEMSLPREAPIMLAGGAWIGLIELYTLWAIAVNTRHSKLTSVNFTAAHYHIHTLVRMRKLYHSRPPPFKSYNAAAVGTRLKLYMRTVQGQFAASRKHDQIYGLLGIACVQDLPPNLRPDYEAPHQEVYKNYTRFLLEKCGDISILNRASCHFKGMPSWVPDYVTSPILITYDHWPGLEFLPGDKMQIRGIQLETCIAFWRRAEKTQKRFISMDDLAHQLASLREFFEMVSQAGCVPMNKMLDRWIDMCLTATNHQDSPSAESARKALRESVMTGRLAGQDSWSTTLILWALNGSLMSTGRGALDRVIRLDVSPKVGDVLCALKGSDDPVLLRPLADGEYTFLGMCFRWENDQILKYNESWFDGKEVQTFTIV